MAQWPAIKQMEDEYGPEVNLYASSAHTLGNPELGVEFAGLMDKAKRLATMYWTVRGQFFSRDHETVLAEKRIKYSLTASLKAVVVIDLVTKDRKGDHWLWEHKTTTNVPNDGHRFRDLQTTWAAAVLEEATGIRVAGVIWNYIRTKEPTVPELLKNGSLSRRSNIDTTWPVYLNAIRDAGLSVEDYYDMRDLLAGRDTSVFFPRYQVNLYAQESVLLGDFIRSAKEAASATRRNVQPIRSIDRHCDFCSYQKLCSAVIANGHGADEELKPLLFRQRGEEASGKTAENTAGNEAAAESAAPF